jgi:hypothetical protein
MRRTVLGLAAVIATAAVFIGAVVPRSEAAAMSLAAGYRASSPEYGMSVFLYGSPATTERDLGKLQAVGFGWQKSLFRWRDIEGRCKGCFSWEESDRVVRASADAGLKIIARLDFQPKWARADGANNGPPDNYQDYADFVKAFVNRYKSGSARGTVQAIEIWNEVNLDREWGGGPINRQTAADYVRLISRAYKAAKAADPSVTVITGALSPTGVSADFAQPDDVYLRWMYESGLQGNYDVLGVNANVQCPCVDADPGTVAGFGHASFYFRRTEQLRQIMVENGEGDKQIWLMEFGWTTDQVNPNYAWYATTEEKKSELILRAFMFASERWAPWIGVMTLWTVADPRWGQDDEQVWWSVTNPDGSPRPAYERLLQARTAGELPLLGPAPAPAPASAHSGQPAQQLRVAGTDGENLNLRDAPSLSAARIKSLPPGTVLLALGGIEHNEGREWRSVRDPDGAEGWVAAEFVAPV